MDVKVTRMFLMRDLVPVASFLASDNVNLQEVFLKKIKIRLEIIKQVM